MRSSRPSCGNTACLSASTRTRSRSARPVPYSWRPPVVGRHMDILFEQDLGAFKTVVNGVLGLSHAIGNAMIGGSTTTMDEAIGRVRAWDQAFLAQLDIAIGDTPVPDEAPKAKVPTKNKKDTEETFAAKQEEYRAQLRDICVYKCAQLRDVTRRRGDAADARRGIRAGKAGSEHGGIQRFHHCRLPARRAIPLHRGAVPSPLHACAA